MNENIFKKRQQRSNLQNKSLHLGCTLLAEKLNDAGFDQSKVLASLPKAIDCRNTMDSIKALYRLIMNAMYGYTSTKQLDSKQISEVWEKLNQILGETLHPDIRVGFPNEEQTEAYLISFKQ